MPRIPVFDEFDDDEFDMPSRERIASRPKEERDISGRRREKTKKHRDPEASKRKEYQVDE